MISLLTIPVALALSLSFALAQELPEPLTEQQELPPAQIRKPDFQEIEADITDPTSPYYYDQLMYRYNKNDTMLNAVDYYNLYYGYSLQSEYNPEYQSPYRDSVTSVLNVGRKLESQDYQSLEYYMLKILEYTPFSIRDLNALAFVYENMSEKERALEQMYKVELVAYTIKNSGTGQTKDSPWTVIFRENATDLLTLLGFSNIRETVITADVSYLGQTAGPGARRMGVFFDFQPINGYLVRVAREQGQSLRPPKRKMEFNPKYNPRSKSNILPKNNKKKL